jgi:YVTN family beta-propeller protein
VRAGNGIVWRSDGKRLYIAGGISNPVNDIYVIEQNADGKWVQGKGFKLTGNDPNKTRITGLALSNDDKTLFAANDYDNHLYALRPDDGKSISRTEVGDHPIACRLSADGNYIGVANWGGASISVFRLTDPAAPEFIMEIKTGAHPNDAALSSDGRSFVSCAGTDAVTVIDAQTGQPQETIKTTLTPDSVTGSTPNAVAVSPDNKTLYVANADNNDVCVVDISEPGKSHVSGFIPTGWYPTAVLVSPDGKKVIIGSGKGTGTGPNPVKLPINPNVPSGFEHHGHQLKGMISFVDAPTADRLKDYTRQVTENIPYRDTQKQEVAGDAKTAIPTRVGDPSPIKHVLYIIKENRTYDQVFGDMAKGNGDPKLCLFGQDVTPNHHALADQFVLLDNLYCSGEVSQDGHPWSTSAYVTDFTQRSWVLSYSGKGETNGNDNVEDPQGGFIWEACRRKGLSYRTYGEYAGHKSLKEHSSLEFIGKGKPGSAPPGRDMGRADIFIREFKAFEDAGTIPAFMIMSLGEDHTSGTSPGAHTPKAMVASNDQAVGKIVDALSHSSAWKEFAIFIIADDAQNGPDHIDSHRTMGLVISPYVRRGAVDSTMYSTASMLHTIELILGLPPLTQYDAAATPMFASFTDRADLTPYSLLAPKIDLSAKNAATAYGAQLSAKMDWSGYDRVDEDALNRILWHSIKGADVPMPSPVRRALISRNGTLPTASKSRDADD